MASANMLPEDVYIAAANLAMAMPILARNAYRIALADDPSMVDISSYPAVQMMNPPIIP
jgi:hypothetical protein